MMKPRGLGLSRGAPAPRRSPMDDMTSESMDGDLEAMGMEYDDQLDPAPRKPMPADRGGPDFDPTDPRQKPRGYDGYARAAAQEAEHLRDEVPDQEAGRAMMEWRRRWLQRAKEAGLDERQASQALDDIEDGL